MPRTTRKKSAKADKPEPPARKKAAVAQPQPAAAATTAAPVSGFAVGDRVTHPQFGEGAVMAIDGAKLSIKFADRRIRQIIDDYVKRR